MSVGERVDTIENALKELAYAGRRTEMSIDGLSQEMREFKVETSAFQEEMSDFKDELAAFKDRVDRDIEESRQDRRQRIKEWGSLANKMGSLVEDVVVPNFPGILKRYFSVVELDDLLVRRRKPHPTDRSRRREFDLIAWTADTVFLTESKSTPTQEAYAKFCGDDKTVFEFFPKLAGRALVKIASALYMPPEVVGYLTRNGCYAMMLGEEMMEIANYPALSGRENPPVPRDW